MTDSFVVTTPDGSRVAKEVSAANPMPVSLYAGGSPIDTSTPVPVTQGALPASGITPVTVALTSATSTSTFTPQAGRGFNVSLWGTFVGTAQMERSFDSGTTWLPITAAGTQLYVWTAPASEQAEETEAGVQYRVRVTSYTSGTVNVRISQ